MADQRHSHNAVFAGLHAHDGGALHWHDEFGEHLAEDLPDDVRAAKQLDWRKHNAIIVTLGVDIGSTTSHLTFSRLYSQTVGDGPSAKAVTVAREILYMSPIILTPYLDEDTIDAETLGTFIRESYAEVAATAAEVDSGCIILTGDALKRKNARAIGEMFAAQAGKFVCASAGHHLEAVLAANGSGTVARSWRNEQTLLNVDIGGGTAKLALVQNGETVGTAAVEIGARQIVKDENGRLIRISDAVRRVAARLGITLELGARLAEQDERQIIDAWLQVLSVLIEQRTVTPLAADLLLTDPLPQEPKPSAVIFSGGVAEFIFQRETKEFGDLGRPLGLALRNALRTKRIALPALINPNGGIRATAIGASVSTVQVGTNFYLTGEGLLPLTNVPVLLAKVASEGPVSAASVETAVGDALVRADIQEGEAPVALRLQLPDGLDAAGREAVARGLCAALPRTVKGMVPFVLLPDTRDAYELGRILREDLQVPGNFLALDGIWVSEFDFLDLGEVIHPTEMIPITVKSLLFAGGLDRKSIKQALQEAARSGG